MAPSSPPNAGLSVSRTVRQPRSPERAPSRPNLFLTWAMKWGAIYLNKLLGAHAVIFMCSPEEPSYFMDPKQLRTLWPETWDQGFWGSEEKYLRLFHAAGNAVLLDETS